MKNLLSVSIAALAFAAVATEPAPYSPITVEVRNITPSVQNTIIPVPVTTIGSTDPVSVHDLVKAANLPENTMLYYFDGTNYKAWKKVSNAWTTPDYAATIGSAEVSAGSTAIHVSVGAALWVSFPEGTTLSDQTIVVYGAPVASKTSTIAVGTNLLANPTGTAVGGSTLATKLASIKPVKGDKITYLGGATTGVYFTYTGSVWKKVADKTITEGLDDLPANGGFWYISNGGAGTINW